MQNRLQIHSFTWSELKEKIAPEIGAKIVYELNIMEKNVQCRFNVLCRYFVHDKGRVLTTASANYSGPVLCRYVDFSE